MKSEGIGAGGSRTWQQDPVSCKQQAREDDDVVTHLL